MYDTSLAWVFNHFGFLGISFLGAIVLSSVFILLYRLIKLPIFIKTVFIFLSDSFFSAFGKYSLGQNH
ncbi:hypothetical protein COT44_01970 [Candidatus Shapirobacteria bacterium CG08_land_8_20_14_0_20_39_18]|uniref:Uncharacterized protein n=1 Tax=Candidatus Shapirobacteria bacterium CG08_land_8_20_14_0_20_39_18 TaxID=1974883 RepID=A0A2M6XDE7_9BACT|nr:MAG: hypothetical protein COT44_01970 [Candidatus Shapirobacteria bacterium CG08_land_8_20_14_0_20_39_18]PIY64906.1 MAG: hypothetical protein COY91_03945 [Candidatus Shapirobacteria bacterium CG_4_10_14_0_8_um_filter_39_15]PJE68131.1 MAG: hypothetical protein COU94_03410 [Candidatus Shapirobacteria bacterium CG10_big_fil_rev_8_21_14_0_10_38_8]